MGPQQAMQWRVVFSMTAVDMVCVASVMLKQVIVWTLLRALSAYPRLALCHHVNRATSRWVQSRLTSSWTLKRSTYDDADIVSIVLYTEARRAKFGKQFIH